MIPVWLSFRYEFIPVPTCGSVFVYMIPVRNAAPVRVIPVRVHSGSCTGTKVSFRYEGWPHSVPVSCKRGNKVRSGMKWVTELTGTSSACVLIRKTALQDGVTTRARIESFRYNKHRHFNVNVVRKYISHRKNTVANEWLNLFKHIVRNSWTNEFHLFWCEQFVKWQNRFGISLMWIEPVHDSQICIFFFHCPSSPAHRQEKIHWRLPVLTRASGCLPTRKRTMNRWGLHCKRRIQMPADCSTTLVSGTKSTPRSVIRRSRSWNGSLE